MPNIAAECISCAPFTGFDIHHLVYATREPAVPAIVLLQMFVVILFITLRLVLCLCCAGAQFVCPSKGQAAPGKHTAECDSWQAVWPCWAQRQGQVHPAALDS